MSLRVRSEALLIHFVNINPGRDMSQTGATDLHVDDIPTLGPFRVSVRCPQKPESVTLEPGGRRLRAQWKEGRLTFTVPGLQIHRCVCLRPWA